MSKQTPQESKDTTIKQQTQEQKEIHARQTSQETKDVFSISKQNIGRLFDDVKKTASECQQSITKLQNECTETFRKVFETSISFQEQLMSKSLLHPRVGEAMLRTGDNLVETYMKACEIQSQVALAAISATTQNVKSMNENSKAFQNMSKTLWNPWAFWQSREN